MTEHLTFWDAGYMGFLQNDQHNTGSLASCGARPDMVEALSWQELSEVATAYASLRLYSQSLFGALEAHKTGQDMDVLTHSSTFPICLLPVFFQTFLLN